MRWEMKLLLLLLFSDGDESLRRGHPCTRPSVHDDFKYRMQAANFFECIAVADNEMGSVKEVEDGASEAGDVYIDRILLLLQCICIYIIIERWEERQMAAVEGGKW